MMLGRFLVRVCALLVPGALRPRWREEWLAELKASRGSLLDHRALGAVTDALDARKYSSRATAGRGFRRAAHSFGGLWFDIRSGIRQLQRHRGFTALSVGVLALGIGINSALFSVVYTVFFKPWPIERPQEIAFIYRNQTSGYVYPARLFMNMRSSDTKFLDTNPGAAAVAGSWGRPLDVQIDKLTEQTWGEMVTPNYFDVIGIKPVIGRTFDSKDVHANPDVGIVISHALWQARFGGASDVVGRQVRVNSRDMRVIGVAEPRFKGLSGVWTPSYWWIVNEQFDPRGNPPTGSIVRMKPGVTAEQLQASVNIQGAVENEETRRRSPRYALPPGVPVYFVRSANDMRVPREFSSTVVPERIASALSIVVMMVLVIATINITGLLLARGITRTTELATRRALGVTPARLARQLLTETICLASAGGALGLVIAWNLVTLFTQLTPDRFGMEAAFDLRVVAFTALVCLTAGLAIGLAPVRQALKVDVLAALAGGYRDSGRYQRRLQHWVVVPQVALSLLLLLVTGVHVRSLRQLEDLPLGYEPDQATVLSMSRNTPEDQNRYVRRRPDAEIALEYQAVYRSLRNVLASEPGLHAGLINYLPTWASPPDLATTERSQAAGAPDDVPVQQVAVSPGTFDALGMRIIAGRDFDDRDTRQVRGVAVVSESISRRLWPNQQAIGQRLATFSPQQSAPKLEWYEVIGVVNDTSAVLPKPNDPGRMYTSLGQAWRPWAWSLVVRGAGPDAITQLRASVGSVDPFTAATRVRPLSSYVDELLYPRRMAAAILGVSGLMGLGLACVGLYGVISLSVARRLRELGIRATLGAQPGDLVRLVLREGGRVAIIGSVIGFAGGIAALRYSAHIAKDIPTADWLVFASVPAALATAILIACYLPARRAGRVDPAETLRE